jgi:hypothetical protein
MDELVWASMGYKPSEFNNLTHFIARMALIVQVGPRNTAAKKELKMLLDTYEEKYSWMDEI